jgi:lipoyl(octanoyl) transferase
MGSTGQLAEAVPAARRLEVRDLGLMGFRPAFSLQEALVADRLAGRAPDTLLLVEHEPVYTLGRNADERHVLASAVQRSALGIDLQRTTRGGEVTYHGPGQLVGYPILRLPGGGRGPVWFVTQLEEVLIRTLADFGVTGRRDPINRGVWVEKDKIAAIGVRVTRQVTLHGFSLNVCVRLEDYAGITPCGIEGRWVTSIDRWVAGVSLADVKPALVHRFREVFGYAA